MNGLPFLASSACTAKPWRSSGHCIKKLEPISSRTPDYARAERVVTLTQKVRSDRVGTPPRAEYRASRPLALPLPNSDFLPGGDLKKGMGGKGEGRLPLFTPITHL